MYVGPFYRPRRAYRPTSKRKTASSTVTTARTVFINSLTVKTIAAKRHGPGCIAGAGGGSRSQDTPSARTTCEICISITFFMLGGGASVGDNSFSARCNIYISCLCYDASVRLLSVCL